MRGAQFRIIQRFLRLSMMSQRAIPSIHILGNGRALPGGRMSLSWVIPGVRMSMASRR